MDGGIARRFVVGSAIQLRAVARRQDRGFRGSFPQRPQPQIFQRAKRWFDLFERKRHAFAQGDRRSVVVDSDREELHVVGLSDGLGEPWNLARYYSLSRISSVPAGKPMPGKPPGT